jgi:hypothetical protein
MQKAIQEGIDSGRILRIENGVVIDAKSGKPFVGDYDFFAARRASDGRIIRPSDPLHQKVMRLLELDHVHVEHPGLAYWDPATADHVMKRQDLITRHIDEVPLIRFKGDGSIWYAWADPSDF